MSAPRILLIDDDPALLDALSRALRAFRCEVLGASTPLGATSLVRSFRPDIIVTDFAMPALDGDRLAMLIRGTFGSTIPIVFHSGQDPEIVAVVVSQVTNSTFIPKPTNPEQLYRTICAILHAQSPWALA